MKVYIKLIATALLAHIIGASELVMKLERIHGISLWILFTFQGFARSDRVVGRLEKMLCNIKPNYCHWTCKIKAKSRYDASMNTTLTLFRTATAIKYHSKAYYQFSNNEYRPMLLDIRVDYCAVEAGSVASVFQNVLKGIWGNRTNLFQHCPLAPGEYYIRDWNFVATDLPSIIPAGRYFIKTNFFWRKRRIGCICFHLFPNREPWHIGPKCGIITEWGNQSLKS